MNNDFQRGAQALSRGITIFGSAILVVCVALLTVTWWRDGRWVWVVIGIAVILVNIVFVTLQFRRKSPAPPVVDDDKD